MTGGEYMKFRLNDYETKDVMRILREWTELDRKEFEKSISRSAKSIKSYLNGERNYTVQLLKDIIKKYNITVVFEKNKK